MIKNYKREREECIRCILDGERGKHLREGSFIYWLTQGYSSKDSQRIKKAILFPDATPKQLGLPASQNNIAGFLKAECL